jgi:hypothetical protein
MKNFNYFIKNQSRFDQTLIQLKFHDKEAFCIVRSLVKTVWDDDPKNSTYIYTLILDSSASNPGKFLDALDRYEKTIFYATWHDSDTSTDYTFEQCKMNGIELLRDPVDIEATPYGNTIHYDSWGPQRYTFQVSCIPMFKIEDVFELTTDWVYDKLVIQPAKDSIPPEQSENISFRRFRNLVK